MIPFFRVTGQQRSPSPNLGAAKPCWLLAAMLGVFGQPLRAQESQPAAAASAAVTRQLEQLALQEQAGTALDRQIQSLRQQQQQLILQLDNQKIYNAHLQRLLESQHQQLQDNRLQLGSIADTEKRLVPLMYRMLADLKRYIEQDLPLKRVQRLSRVKALNEMLGQNQLTDAEKLRRILETYQIELTYNRQMNHYQAQQEIDGQWRHLEMLSLGKLALFARSPDHHSSWFWEQAEQRWRPLPDSYRQALETAFAIADKQQPAALLTLPLELSSPPRPEEASQ